MTVQIRAAEAPKMSNVQATPRSKEVAAGVVPLPWLLPLPWLAPLPLLLPWQGRVDGVDCVDVGEGAGSAGPGAAERTAVLLEADCRGE